MHRDTGKPLQSESPQPIDLATVSMRKIPEHRIDMAAHLCSDGDCARLVSHLRALDLYREDLGFSVIHPTLLDAVLTTGTYRISKDGEPKKTIFCLRAAKDPYGEESLIDSYKDHKWSDYVGFGDQAYKTGIPIVVYDASKLRPARTADEYQFTCDRKLDAVIGVIILENL